MLIPVKSGYHKEILAGEIFWRVHENTSKQFILACKNCPIDFKLARHIPAMVSYKLESVATLNVKPECRIYVDIMTGGKLSSI